MTHCFIHRFRRGRDGVVEIAHFERNANFGIPLEANASNRDAASCALKLCRINAAMWTTHPYDHSQCEANNFPMCLDVENTCNPALFAGCARSDS